MDLNLLSPFLLLICKCALAIDNNQITAVKPMTYMSTCFNLSYALHGDALLEDRR